ncbi:MAG: class I SAM-dependent methyltransferase [Solirubrobacteraceae bacterium]
MDSPRRPSRILLPGLVRKLSPIDLFVHDSDHSYAGQVEEYRQVWPHLERGASLISDDVCNPAFTDFANEVGERPYLIAPQGHSSAVGLLVKTC